jgi:2-succinyl-5-enolpyruvyl-6-hydroxy-3-cyclohexene-1-carboxylate synthase
MNETWAKKIVSHLITLGVETFYIAPGSRSTPLVLAVAKLVGGAVHFDERGLAFCALGYGLGAKKPAALITTSGSAVGNLLPAVMEAFHHRVPLILLTADRPPELRDCGANQTGDQVKLFGGYVRWHVDLPCPDPHLPERYLATTLSQAVFRAQEGPVHINCMFREPLLGGAENAPPPVQPTFYEPADVVLSPESVEKWRKRLASVEKGVIVAGSYRGRPAHSVLALAEALRWPVLPDILSNVRSLGAHPCVAAHYDLILQNGALEHADAVLHLGDRVVSKPLMRWLEASSPSLYCLVANHPFRHDPQHLVTHRFFLDPFAFCEALLPVCGRGTLQAPSVRGAVSTFFAAQEAHTEPGLFHFLQERLDAEWALFLSNSMPIRDADGFFFPEHPSALVYANRGLSGIDGVIATAAGLAEGARRPVCAVVGDQAALHDLNSLALLHKSRYPVLLLIINNGGGGIFSFLPQAHLQEHFETYWAGAHAFSFEQGARLFDLPYYNPENRRAWETLFLQAAAHGRSCLIEIRTNRQENVCVHRELAACALASV